MRVEVKFGSQRLLVELPDSPAPPTLLQLKQQLHAQTGVVPEMQKLLGKPKLNDAESDSKPLEQLGVRNNAKLMLIGSALADVAAANVASSACQQQREEERENVLRNLPLRLWMLPSFAGFMADPYVDGRGQPVEGCGAALALLTLDVSLSRINKLGTSTLCGGGNSITALLQTTAGEEVDVMPSHPLLPLLSVEHRRAIQRAHAVLCRCYYFTEEAAQAQEPEEVLSVVKKAVSLVNGLAVGEWLLMPGGWIGVNSVHVMYFLVQRRAPEVFSVVLVNRGGDGGEYHPTWPTAEKLLSCPVLRFDDVSGLRLLDHTFWLLLLSLWMRGNNAGETSEFIRAEVLYDVLLPWLVERGTGHADNAPLRFATEMLLASPSAAEDVAAAGSSERVESFEGRVGERCFAAAIHEHGATGPRSASSGIKSAVTAFVYLLEQYGVQEREVRKLVKYAMKYEFMMRAAEDLSAHARCFIRCCDGETRNTPSAAKIEKAVQQLHAAGVDNVTCTKNIRDVLRIARAENIILKSERNVLLGMEHFVDKIVLVYCAGLQDPSCASFSPILAESSPRLRRASPAVELLFLSCDADTDMYEKHAAMFTFPRAAHQCTALLKSLDVRNIPELLVFASDGQLLHRRGVAALLADPEAAQFPHGLLWSGATCLTATDVEMLHRSAAQLAHHTKKRTAINGAGSITACNAERVLHLLDAVHATVDALPKEPYVTGDKLPDIDLSEENGLGAQQQHAFALADLLHQEEEERNEEQQEQQDRMEKQCDVTVEASMFPNASLLPAASTAAYHGQPLESSLPELQDLSSVERVTGWVPLEATLRRVVAAVEALWARARHSGTTSRVAIQMHIIELVSWLFLEVVPTPLPSGFDLHAVPAEERQAVAAFYTQEAFPADGDAQASVQEHIYSLLLSYTTAWQAVEGPTRAFDAERCLVSMAMLVVYDAVARHTLNSGRCRILASLLNSNGGYYLSTTVGKPCFSFAQVSATLELVQPHFLLARSAILRYIAQQQQLCRHELFDIRMPEKLEIRKGSVTVDFLRRFLDNCGYPLPGGGGGTMAAGMTEMDMLMQWFCSPRTRLTREHPEFARIRDIVLLTKFLATMEMRDAQVLRSRRQLDEFATWRLTFDEDAPGRQMSAGWRTTPAPPEWECMLVRGRDSDIADIVVKGFGDRELLYGEGLVLQSPIDVAALLGVSSPTEDDVLHAKTLPTFGGTMSAEEAELLLSCLTTPYVRLPLVLDFFASQDRHTYLFTPAVQNVLRAVLFEPAAFVMQERLQQMDPTLVPFRLGEQQRQEIEMRRLHGDLSVENYEACLGTTYGLLLNELQRSPTSVLVPLRRFLASVAEIGLFSVYSPNASYVLFIVGVVCDVLAFCNFLLQQWQRGHSIVMQTEVLVTHQTAAVQFLFSKVLPMLQEWCQEAGENDDTPTQCVLHSYTAAIHRAAWKTAGTTGYTPGDYGGEGGGNSMIASTTAAWEHLVAMLEACAFVRARHSFGMGMQRTQLAAQEDDALLSPKERLLRFLQAQGLDTTHASPKMLEEGQQLMLAGGRRRAVFVQIRSRYYNDTVRVPNLIRSDARSTTDSKKLKLPPADVPENVIFTYLMQDQRSMTEFLRSLSAADLTFVFQRIARVVLLDRAHDRNDNHKNNNNECSGGGGGGNRNGGSGSGSGGGVASPLLVRGDSRAAGAESSYEEAGASSWELCAPGVYRGPAATGLVFHLNTCELFWRNDELKPVPDSMSHFSDFETILGRDVMQCGLVCRYRHCHWVHVVGTPFDVMEWTPPNPLDQGVRAPLVLQGNLPKEPVLAASFEGVMFNRVLDVYDDTPWPVRAERWAVELVRAVLREAFSHGRMVYFPIAQTHDSPSAAQPCGDHEEEVGERDVCMMRFIMNDAPQYAAAAAAAEDEEEDEEGGEDRSTWKELVAYRRPAPHLHVFNLVSHARRMYRSLVFTSNQHYCLHSLTPIVRPRRLEQLHLMAFQAGEFTRRVRCEGSLAIYRYNAQFAVREMYLPARLLQGVLPSALLEAFLFWQDEDDLIRGYPTGDSQDYWFNYALEVQLRRGGRGCDCIVTRRDITSHHQRHHQRHHQNHHTNSRKRCRSNNRSSNEDDKEEEEVCITDAQVALMHSAMTFLTNATCRWVLLRTHGDVSAAIQWAHDPANREAIASVDDDARRRGEEAREAMLPSLKEEEEEEDGDDDNKEEEEEEAPLVLLNLMCNEALFPLLQLLKGVEDCSHILVWGRVPPRRRKRQLQRCMEGESRATLVDVVTIELPRLRAKFHPHVDTATGSLRLHLAEHPGWYVAEAADSKSSCRKDGAHDFLQRLRQPFQECLTLCNSTNDFALMVPNHDFTAMRVRDDPFSPLLLFDRASLQWQGTVPSPFYLYAVHSCGSFLIPPSLAASLYYAVMQCATRHYAGAMRTIESCYTDSMFSSEESFMFALMERTLSDRSPDAHAVRLKLAHAVQYSSEELPWPLHVDLTGYLEKIRHVSQACQLTREEVMDLLRRCPKQVPIVHAQLQLWAALERGQREQNHRHQALANAVVSVKIATPSLHRCGRPRERLLQHQWSSIAPQKPPRVTYAAPAPGELEEEELVRFLWEDKLLLDEESGANSKLGFYFLYTLKKGDVVSTKLFREDVHVTLGELLSRWFHLRHARWGREVQRDGETEVLPSWCATVLQLLDMAPSAAWPHVVSDTMAQRCMRQGASLTQHTDDGRATPSALLQFYQALDRVARETFESHRTVQLHREMQLFSQSCTSATRMIRVRMTDHLQPRISPANTGLDRLQLSFRSFCGAAHALMNEEEEEGKGEGNDVVVWQRLMALFGEPLSEVQMLSSFVRSNTGSSCQSATNTNTNTTAGGAGDAVRLPFDLRQHVHCSSPLAQDMLRRLEEDAGRFALQQQQQVHCSLSTFADNRLHTILCDDHAAVVREAIAAASSDLQQCVDALSHLSARDESDVRELTQSALHLANNIYTNDNSGSSASSENAARVREYRLQRIQGSRCAVPLEWLLGALLSTEMKADLRAVNPFHGDVERLQADLVLLMLLANRSFMAQQAVQSIRQIMLFLELCALLRGVDHCSASQRPRVSVAAGTRQARLQELLQCFSLVVDVDTLARSGRPHVSDGDNNNSSLTSFCCCRLPEIVVSALDNRLQQLSSAAVDQLMARRHYAMVCDGDGDGSRAAVILDPRYLLFEFIHNILLRARQVEMVQWFVANTRAGVSRVQQMIMGQGKTTVVGPLLALILADGVQLVTQVMPTALLEQTRGILRRCFSVVVPKQIYTLQFDRSVDDTDTTSVALLRQKLTAAAKTRAILISAPECIKSVFLKMIEQMHLIEATPMEKLEAVHDTVDERAAAYAQLLLRRTKQRASMADAITPIIQLWQRGVLIMDEVDVLLHPLRSELNFPVGLKHPIDLSGPRWTLPMHLLDAVFFFQLGRTTAVDDQRQRHDYGEESSTNGGGGGNDDCGARARQRQREEVLTAIRDAIAVGYETCALQREPHLVLLDHVYYRQRLLPALLPWVQLWLFDQIQRERQRTASTALTTGSTNSLERKVFLDCTAAFLQSRERPGKESALGHILNTSFHPFEIQLLSLAHDWLHCLLPHVLAKINRVSFGLLQPHGIALMAAGEPERMPLSRRMMAVPFVAKDVPSRSSEFAHPDVVIGLTILAFRYEGMRFTDVKELLLQLKQDFARQSGPKEHRPAAKLYHHWLQLTARNDSCVGEEDDDGNNNNNGGGGGSSRRISAPPPPPPFAAAAAAASRSSTHDRSGIPLSQLQVTDEAALRALHRRLQHLPEVMHYYLCSHVFPRTMNFQGMKLSACGHELGSSMLFTQRIGFSGTPSNLLPLDLGECFYEPGSDGRVLSVLTDPSIVTAEVLPPDWMPLRVLDRIATADPPYHALIDAGALITNMDNEDVARYLVGKLSPALFDGVVFLDSRDRQMILQRSNGLMVPVTQSGIALTRRFTFFDQVHTTGTDVKQAASVTAVLTLGKDLVFRDYAQGAYRMRGVGKGQRLCLYLIPEVLLRIHTTLGDARTGNLLLDIPAWLLLNSMQMESVQFIKLTMQEMANVWRKRALHNLLVDSIHANEHPDLYNEMTRCRRFHMPRQPLGSETGEEQLPEVSLLQSSIREFRELIAYPVDSTIDTPVPLLQRLVEHMDGKPNELIAGDAASQQLLRELMQGLATSLAVRGSVSLTAVANDSSMNLDSEVVHEQEAEEEQEQEAEQEEQRISAASRDDEFYIPWCVRTLQRRSEDQLQSSSTCFYPLRGLRVRPEQPPLLVDLRIQVSDNYYRKDWHGTGERRLKNAFLSLEWLPTQPTKGDRPVVFSGLIALAEGESLRWMMHHPTSTSASIRMALRVVGSGHYMDASDAFAAAVPHARERDRFPTSMAVLHESQSAPPPPPPPAATVERDGAVLLYRFLNNEMFFSPGELTVLEMMLQDVTHADRLCFFMDCLRVRRRHRNHWDDAPVAALFVAPESKRNARPLAILAALRARFEELLERATRKPQTAQLVTQLQSFHTRLTEACKEHKSGGEQLPSSAPSVPVNVVARILHDVFGALLKPFTLQDIEQALQYLSRNDVPGFPISGGANRVAPASATSQCGSTIIPRVVKAFPVLQEDLMRSCLAHVQESSAPSVTEPWRCQQCTLVNHPATRWCAACETARPSGGAEGATGNAGEVDEPWPCQQCTFINESRSQPFCTMCLATNPTPLSKVQQNNMTQGFGAPAVPWECPVGYWICSVEHGGCSKFNSNDVFYCQVCDKARPNLATLRF